MPMTLRYMWPSPLKMQAQQFLSFNSVSASKLKLNPDKTEFIIFGTPVWIKTEIVKKIFYGKTGLNVDKSKNWKVCQIRDLISIFFIGHHCCLLSPKCTNTTLPYFCFKSVINSFAAGGDGRRLRGRPREATAVDYYTERGWRPLSTIVFFVLSITTV